MKHRLGFLFIFVVPLISLIIGILTLGQYGINWDEPYHYRRGQSFLHFLLTGRKTYDGLPKYPSLAGDSDNPDFRDAQKNWEEIKADPGLSDPNLRRSFYQDDNWNGEYFIDLEKSYGHPPLNGILASVFNKFFYQKLGVLGDLESYKLFVVTIVSVATFAVAFFIWKEFGIIESLISSLVMTTFPLLLGEQHFNIKDPVEMAFYALTMITAFVGIKRNKLIWLFVSSVLFGLALATKFNIVFSIIPLSIWLIYYLYTGRNSKEKQESLKNLGVILLAAPLIILGILLLSYPSLWSNPMGGIKEIFGFYLRVGYPESKTFFNTYPSLWIIYTTPPIVLFLLATFLIFIKKLILKNSFVLLLFLWAITAIARNSLFGALSYGGVRLIMEYVPAFAMLSGIAAGYLIRSPKIKGYSWAIFGFILAGFIPTIINLIQIHPNENIYFNFLVGGLSGAKEKGLPSWGDSYGNAYYQGILWLNMHGETGARLSTPVGLTSNLPRIKLRPDIAVSPHYWSGLKHEGEYLIELTYDYPPKEWFALKYLEEAIVPVYEVIVDNVAIAKVWKNDPAYLKDVFKKTRTLSAEITLDSKAKTVQVEIPKVEKIMKVNLTQVTSNCDQVRTGAAYVSIDGKNWTREPEDIALDQLGRHELKELGPSFEFYLMAKEAKYVKFVLDNESSCLLKARSPIVTVLE